MGKPRVIYWFRTDLRLHDSPALQAALDLDPAVLWPIFTWDPHYVYRARGGLNRWQYLLDCQNDLSTSITRLNAKSKLFVLREAPQTLFPKLFKSWGVTHLVYERDTDAYARGRDDVVRASARAAGVKVITRSGRTLWDSDAVVRANAGEPTMSLAQLRAAGARVGEIARPIPAPSALPDPGEMPLDFGSTDVPDDGLDLNAKWRSEGSDQSYAAIAGPDGDFAIETLAELGYPAATTPHRGGETRALAALDAIIADHEYTATFRKPQTSPAAFEPQSTTLLSPALHFGSLSVRLFYHRVQDVVDKYKRGGGKGASMPPESLTGQLLFRDMYFAAQAAIGPAFSQTVGNSYCRFIPWHLPSSLKPSQRVEARGGHFAAADKDSSDVKPQLPLQPPIRGFQHDVDSDQAERWFRRWEAGRTGFPWIDALMRQLRVEGWIHHLGRHSVACFLTRGGCYVSWERGLDVFEELLLDHEPACNAGNWQWLSCTAFFAQYFRCYSPVSFGKKWDPNGNLIRRWIPELAALDKKYIYEPWKAPEAELRRAGVVLASGDDDETKAEGTYCTPMFDFDERRRTCMRLMKQAYDAGLKGDDPRVLDGSWRSLFSESDDAGMAGAGLKHEHDHESDDGGLADDAEAAVKRKDADRSGSSRTVRATKRDKGQSTLDQHVVAKRQKTEPSD